MNKKEIFNNYIKIISFSLVGSIGMQLYYFTDGIFAGIACGDNGLSAISLSWTFVRYIMAISSGIGMGGSILFSLNKNNEKKRNLYFKQTIKLLLISGIILNIYFIFTYKKTLVNLNATEELYEYACTYSSVVCFTTLLQVLAYGLLPLLRNIGCDSQASKAIGIGYIINFAFDYILLIPIPLKMLGCVLAYLFGQIFIFYVCIKNIIPYYKALPKEKSSIKEVLFIDKDIVINGLAPLGIYLSQNLSSTTVSKNFVTYGGSYALASYSTSGYLASITAQIFQCMVESSQPLISHHYGRKEYKESSYISRLMYIFWFVGIILTDIIVYIFIKPLTYSFNLSNEANAVIFSRFPMYFIFYDCFLFNKTSCTYLSATNHSFASTFIIYLQPILIILFNLFLPQKYGVDGVWNAVYYGYLISSLVTILIIIFIKISNKKQSTN